MDADTDNSVITSCIVAVIVIVVLVVIPLLLLYFFGGKGTTTSSPTSSPATTTQAPGVNGRYVKLVGMVASPHRILNIAEIRVYSGDSTNIAKNKAVTMSSIYGTFVGSNVVDDVDTNFAHTSSLEDPWMMIDLGSDNLISKIVVTNRKDCCSNRTIGSTLQILDSSKNILYTSTPFTGKNGVTSYLDSYEGNSQYVVYPPSLAVSDT